MFSLFGIIPACDGPTNARTDGHMMTAYTIASRSKNKSTVEVSFFYNAVFYRQRWTEPRQEVRWRWRYYLFCCWAASFISVTACHESKYSITYCLLVLLNWSNSKCTVDISRETSLRSVSMRSTWQRYTKQQGVQKKTPQYLTVMYIVFYVKYYIFNFIHHFW